MSARPILFVGFMLAVAITCTVAVAQQPPAPPTPPTPLATAAPVAPGQTYTSTTTVKVNAKEQAQVNKLAKDFVKTEKEDEKKEIRKKLNELLAKQFDQYVQQQQKELENLEKQIADLRATVKKRVDAKQAIVDRRVEQILYDAQGLGWNNPSSGGAKGGVMQGGGFGGGGGGGFGGAGGTGGFGVGGGFIDVTPPPATTPKKKDDNR